jgi:mevalonate kinase
MVLVSAPAKLILLGEQILFGGDSALGVALDLRLRVETKPAEFYIVDGYKMTGSRHPYTMKAIERIWETDTPIEFKITSNIPSGLGLGSSTALTVATVAALLEGQEGVTPEKIMKESYEVELAVQGTANPIDATVVANGSAILATNKPSAYPPVLRLHTDERDWHMSPIEVPDIILVIGIAPRKMRSSDMLGKVERFKDKSGFAKDILKELGTLTDRAITVLKDQDLEKFGALLDKGHKLLNILGLNTPHLEKMVNAARRHSYGAKVSAYSGGNAMVAVTDTPEKVTEAIEGLGGSAITTKLAKTGVRTI